MHPSTNFRPRLRRSKCALPKSTYPTKSLSFMRWSAFPLLGPWRGFPRILSYALAAGTDWRSPSSTSTIFARFRIGTMSDKALAPRLTELNCGNLILRKSEESGILHD